MADMNVRQWSPSGPRNTTRLRPEQWESIRDPITEWVGDGLQFSEIVSLLSEKHGFRISKRQLQKKLRAWGLQGRRGRRTVALHSADAGTARLVQESGLSHSAAHPALHSFTQAPSSQMNLQQLPSLNIIFREGHERLGFEHPFGALRMSRGPSHKLERFRSQDWVFEAMDRRLQKMQQAIQNPFMDVHDMMATLDLCAELCLISIFIDEADEATGMHRSGYAILFSILSAKVGMFTPPTTKVFQSITMVINFWVLGWPVPAGEEDREPRRLGCDEERSRWMMRFIAPLLETNWIC